MAKYKDGEWIIYDVADNYRIAFSGSADDCMAWLLDESDCCKVYTYDFSPFIRFYGFYVPKNEWEAFRGILIAMNLYFEPSECDMGVHVEVRCTAEQAKYLDDIELKPEE